MGKALKGRRDRVFLGRLDRKAEESKAVSNHRSPKAQHQKATGENFV
jgi:hypothetical protein